MSKSNLKPKRSYLFFVSSLLMTVIFVLSLSACGTQVEVGDNGEKGDEAGPLGTGNSTGGGGVNGSSADGTGGSAFSLTCFGEVPTLPDYLDDFCSSVDDGFTEDFAKAIEDICVNHYFANLFADGCSWEGDNPKEDYYGILEHTDLADESTAVFKYYGAFSVTPPIAKTRAMDLIFEGLSDPNFGDTYKTIPNLKLSNVSFDKKEGWINYTAEVASSSATVKFDGRVDMFHFGDQLTVIFDKAVANMTIMKRSRVAIFLLDLGDGRTRTVFIDEKELHDSGHHDIAVRGLIKSSMDRLGNSYENAVIDNGG